MKYKTDMLRSEKRVKYQEMVGGVSDIKKRRITHAIIPTQEQAKSKCLLKLKRRIVGNECGMILQRT